MTMLLFYFCINLVILTKVIQGNLQHLSSSVNN